MRSARFGTEGAVVCIVLDQRALIEGRDYEFEGNDNIIRFHCGLPPEVVAYILVREEIRFVGAGRASVPKPWPKARFRNSSGVWIPLRRAPVRFSESESFSTLSEYLNLCIGKLLKDLNGASPLEVFSVLYSLVKPWNSLRHTDILHVLRSLAPRTRRVGKWTIFMQNGNADRTHS
jgi:hypothetical protein